MFIVTASVVTLFRQRLKYYDSVLRKMRIGEFIPKELEAYADSLMNLDYVYVLIPRAKDRNGRIHRLIPSFLLPYKHYPAEEVASAFCNEYGQCSSASESTIKRWKRWWRRIWGEFRMKALEWAGNTEFHSTIAATDDTTLAPTLKRILPPFWMSTILPLFTSEALRLFPHRL